MTKCKERPDSDVRLSAPKPLPFDMGGASTGLSPLGLAAKLVETAAYELAGTESTSLVSELILISARLSTIDEQTDPAKRRETTGDVRPR